MRIGPPLPVLPNCFLLFPAHPDLDVNNLIYQIFFFWCRLSNHEIMEHFSVAASLCLISSVVDNWLFLESSTNINFHWNEKHMQINKQKELGKRLNFSLALMSIYIFSNMDSKHDYLNEHFDLE